MKHKIDIFKLYTHVNLYFVLYFMSGIIFIIITYFISHLTYEGTDFFTGNVIIIKKL